MACSCNPPVKHGHHYVQFIGTYFQICAWTTRDVVAFAVGLGNILFWMFAQVPQLYQNYKTKSVESLSATFLALWLVGDMTNFVGCITTHQSPIQLYTSIYFLIMDIVTLSQYAYYRRKAQRPETRVMGKTEFGDSSHAPGRYQSKVDLDVASSLHHPVNSTSPQTSKRPSLTLYAVLFAVLVFARTYTFVDSWAMNDALSTSSSVTDMFAPSAASAAAAAPVPTSSQLNVGRVLLSYPESAWGLPSTVQFNEVEAEPNNVVVQLSTNPLNPSDTTFHTANDLKADPQPGDCDYVESYGIVAERIGTVSAWLSGLIYVTSRIPQIMRNYERKSTEGLSLGMFILAMLGNTCYGIGLLLPEGADLSSSNFFMNTFPYLIGSLGTNISAIVILAQAWVYRHNKAPLHIDLDEHDQGPTYGAMGTHEKRSAEIIF